MNNMHRLFIASLVSVVVYGCQLISPSDSVSSGQDSEWEATEIDGSGLVSLYFTSRDTGYAGSVGHVLRTVDGGITWENKYPGSTKTFYGTYFLNGSVGYAGGDAAELYKTTNGGNSWTSLRDSAWSSNGSFEYMFISDLYFHGDTGFVILNMPLNDRILKTLDGGVSWSVVWQGSQYGQGQFAIRFKDALIGYTAGSEGIYKTTDGGDSWVKKNTGVQYGLTSVAINGDTLSAVGSEGVFRSVDAGETWDQVFDSHRGYSLNAIAFLDADTGYAVGGRILKTYDGGKSWQVTSYNVASVYTVYDIDCPHAGTCFVGAGYGKLLKRKH